jgi:hypothetical protein
VLLEHAVFLAHNLSKLLQRLYVVVIPFSSLFHYVDAEPNKGLLYVLGNQVEELLLLFF